MSKMNYCFFGSTNYGIEIQAEMFKTREMDFDIILAVNFSIRKAVGLMNVQKYTMDVVS